MVDVCHVLDGVHGVVDVADIVMLNDVVQLFFFSPEKQFMSDRDVSRSDVFIFCFPTIALAFARLSMLLFSICQLWGIPMLISRPIIAITGCILWTYVVWLCDCAGTHTYVDASLCVLHSLL